MRRSMITAAPAGTQTGTAPSGLELPSSEHSIAVTTHDPNRPVTGLFPYFAGPQFTHSFMLSVVPSDGCGMMRRGAAQVPAWLES